MEDRWHEVLDGAAARARGARLADHGHAALAVRRRAGVPERDDRASAGRSCPTRSSATCSASTARRPAEIDPDVAAKVLASPRAEQLAHEEHGLDLGGRPRALRRRDQRRAAAAADDAPGGAGRGDARAARATAAPRRRDTRSSTLVAGLVERDLARGRDPGARAARCARHADERCSRDVDAVVFDVDGTLLHASDPSGVQRRAPDPPARSRRSSASAPAAGRILFFTNGTGRPPADGRRRPARRSASRCADEEYHEPRRRRSPLDRPQAPRARSVLVLGGHGVVAPLTGSGRYRWSTRRAGGRRRRARRLGRRLTYAALRAACDSVWAGAPLLATSTAAVFSVNGGRPRAGRARSSPASARRPAPARSRWASRRRSRSARCAACSACRRARTLVVGDDLALEIAMAQPPRQPDGARPHGHLVGSRTSARRGTRPPPSFRT